MKFEMIYDLQSIYRDTLNAMSRPGTIYDCSQRVNRLTIELDCSKMMTALMLMLLDADTSFHAISKNDDLNAKAAAITYSKIDELSQAHFIFITADQLSQFETVMTQASIGTLSNPHTSATLIVEVPCISNKNTLTLHGCGIENHASLDLGFHSSWIDVRSQVNAEFPLGIDLIFIDASGKLCALPRTTQIERRMD